MGGLHARIALQITATAACLLFAACASQPPPVVAVPALVVHNHSGGDIRVDARACGQPDQPPQHSYAVGAGQTGTFEPGSSCFDFTAMRGSEVVGKQGEVTLRHEMEWVIGR